MADALPLLVRHTEPGDSDAILALVAAAFAGNANAGQYEVDVVQTTWDLSAGIPGLDLVAVLDGEIVGHVLGARADLGGTEVPAVAPLAVLPAHQRRGVGIQLMNQLNETAGAQGWPLVALLGDPNYYGRFGYEAAGSLGIVYPPVGPDSPAFQVLRLPAYQPDVRGELSYCWELD